MKAYATRKEQGSSQREPRGFFHREVVQSDETLIIDVRGASRPAQLVELRLSRLLSNTPVRVSHMQVLKLSRNRFWPEDSDAGNRDSSAGKARVTREVAVTKSE